MTFNWKQCTIVLIDLALVVYLVLAVTAFNHPDSKATVCTQVKINISADVVDGFLTTDGIKQLLQSQKQYPLAQPMEQVNTRNIEEVLLQSPLVEQAQCYKTLNGHVCIDLKQRLPVMHIKAENGEDYYLDNKGRVMPQTHYASHLAIATGRISQKYAQRYLTAIGNLIVHDKFWRNQIEQINVLPDGSLEIVPLVGNHIAYLGRPYNIEQKLDRLRKFYLYGLSRAGWNKYAYISVEFDNQIICKKHNASL